MSETKTVKKTRKKKITDETPSSGFGPIVENSANVLGKPVSEFVLDLLYKTVTIPLDEDQRVTCIPGCKFSGIVGPGTQTDVVIIGKMPWKEETFKQDLRHGKCGKLLERVFKAAGIDYTNWYLTNLVKFMPPGNDKKLKSSWIKECLPLLELELEVLKPKYILALGGDVVKALFGKQASLTRLRGATHLEYKGAQVIVTNHPMAVDSEPSLLPGFERDIQVFNALVAGKDIAGVMPTTYVQVTSDIQLLAVTTAVLQAWTDNPEIPRRVALDCEWGGKDGADSQRSQFRTIQFSVKDHEAYTIILRRQGLVYDPATCCSEEVVASCLNVMCSYPGVGIGGHNFRSDWIRLQRIGVMCTDAFLQNGVDTMLMYHLLYPAEEGHGLEQLSLRFTDLGRYDLPIQQWLIDNKYLSQKGKGKELIGKAKLRKFGYAEVPDDLLNPRYAPADVDVVIRSWPILEEKLKAARVANPYTVGSQRVETLWDLYRQIIHPANLPLLEVESVGIQTDGERLKRLTELFEGKLTEMVAQFRKDISWPDFNYRSTDQKKEFLFGDVLTGKKSRPVGAVTLDLQPVKTTEKPSRSWDRVSIGDIEKHRVNPAVDSETLKILGHMKPLAESLQKIGFVDQVVKNFLRPPTQEEEDDEVEWNEGLIGLMSSDSRIRTSISQISDTGRHRSSDPNMQNLPKKQEAELRLIFSTSIKAMKDIPKWASMSVRDLKLKGVIHPDYQTIRSCFMASPGHVLIESDYRQAELCVLAHLSKDPDMMAIMADPSRDLHSEMAITAFRLNCKPEEVKSLYPVQRVMAKNCNFG